jgi:hypothetical protein
VAEQQPQVVIWRASQDVATSFQTYTAAITAKLRDLLLWLRFMAIVCTLMGGLLRMVEPNTWLGHLFAARFEAAKAGYRTLLHVTDLREGRTQRRTPLTKHDLGFQEILELALTSRSIYRCL